MTQGLSYRRLWRGTARILEHMIAVVVGFVMMVIGLALGVTMIMLPAGLVIGLLGAAIVVMGIFGRLDGVRD